MKLVTELSFVDQVLETYFQKGTLTNTYLLPEEYRKHIERNDLWYEEEQGNFYFYLKKNLFFRLYYFINRPDYLYSFNQALPLVLEILYRGEKNFPRDHQEYWIKSGFKNHLSRDSYFLKNSELKIGSSESSLVVKKASSVNEIFYAKSLIDSNLDVYTGDALSEEEMAEFAEKGLVYVAYLDNRLCGMLQAEVKNQVFWLGHLVVDAEFRGKGIAQRLVDYYLEEGVRVNNCKQFQLWVIQDNLAAVNLYKKNGFIYLNKSTFSMLKIS